MWTWTILRMEKEKWRHGNSERTIIVLYNEGLHGESVASNSCERSMAINMEGRAETVGVKGRTNGNKG